jgi:exopolysaccharide biosynthesis protein
VIALSLPQTIAPPPPFPLVIAQSRTSEFVAPGIRRATYRLQTSDGPLIVSVVAVDPREPSVRFESVVASDRMISAGETVSSMARRTGAVAGINADYFDIGNTNQPLNVVVKDGALLRTPSKRVVLDVRTDRSIHFENLSFSGSVAYGNAAVPLTTVNQWPPEGGAAFLTPAYGSLKAAPGVSIAELVPADPLHVATTIAGTYRVAAVAPAVAQDVDGPLLGLGPAALKGAPLPSVGDSVAVSVSTVPSLEDIESAVGGGPLLVSGSTPAVDPNAPAPEETDVRFPVSGAGTTRNGDLLLATVDGRNAELSIGVTRPEFAALFVGLGATDAMAFDSGGSATLVARVLGDDAATVQNAPSDGEERAVADGLFVYSDAPKGPPARLVVRPESIVALPRISVPIRLAVTDAAGHALGSAHLPGGDSIFTAGLSERRVLRVGKLAATVPIEIVPTVARLSISADRRDPNPGETITFSATGFDDSGRVVALGDAVRWSADRGTFAKRGIFVVAARDARVVANAGGASAAYALEVGRRTSALPYFDPSHVTAWHFASAPNGAPGSLALDPNTPAMELSYDFTGGERAAYATTDFTLPGDPQTFSVDIRGDGSGVGVRAAFVNRFGERRALTLANSVDWSGWQSRTIALPDDLNPPVRLVALYVVNSLANGATHAMGTLAFRHATATIAGTP